MSREEKQTSCYDRAHNWAGFLRLPSPREHATEASQKLLTLISALNNHKLFFKVYKINSKHPENSNISQVVVQRFQNQEKKKKVLFRSTTKKYTTRND